MRTHANFWNLRIRSNEHSSLPPHHLPVSPITPPPPAPIGDQDPGIADTGPIRGTVTLIHVAHGRPTSLPRLPWKPAKMGTHKGLFLRWLAIFGECSTVAPNESLPESGKKK